MAVAGRRALVKVSGGATSFSNEPATLNADGTEATIDDPAKRIWARHAPIAVEVSTDGGSTWGGIGGFTPNRLRGSVKFDAAQDADTQVRISGEYLPLTTVAEAHSYGLDLSGNNADVTRFGDEFVRRIQAQRDASGSLSEWVSVDNYFYEKLTSGEPVVIAFYKDKDDADPAYLAWGILNSNSMSAAADGATDRSVEWEGAPDAEGREISIG